MGANNQMCPTCSRSFGALLATLLLLTIAVTACDASRTDTGLMRRMLVVGGKAAQDEERYPYMTRIHFLLDDSLGLLAGCGGTLITPRIVLTAAHCMALASKDGSNIFLRVGAYNPLMDEARRHKSELRRVQEFRVHPAYVQLPEDQPTSPHDLALIVLDSPVPPEFPTIALAQEGEPYPAAGAELQAVGWGSTDTDNTRVAYALQNLGLPVVGLPQCAQQWSYAGAGATLIGEGHLCAGLQSQQNICFGDSGGPLLRLGGSPQQDVQLGITSFSFPECALPGMPSVFTFIPKYRKWIDEQLLELDPPTPALPPSPPSQPSPPAEASTSAEVPLDESLPTVLQSEAAPPLPQPEAVLPPTQPEPTNEAAAVDGSTADNTQAAAAAATATAMEQDASAVAQTEANTAPAEQQTGGKPASKQGSEQQASTGEGKDSSRVP